MATHVIISEDVALKRFPPIKWGQVFAGAVAGFATLLLMSALGMAIGVSVTPDRPAQAEEAVLWVGLGAAVWWFLTAIVTGLVGGYAYARRTPAAFVGAEEAPLLPGVLIWATGMLLLFALLIFGLGSLLGPVGAAMSGTLAVNPPAAIQPADPESMERAAAISRAGVWTIFVSMLAGLGATLAGISSARKVRRKTIHHETEAERRPVGTRME